MKGLDLKNLSANYNGNIFSVINICMDREVVDLESTELLIEYEIPFEEVEFFIPSRRWLAV